MDMYLNGVVWYLAAQSWQIALLTLALAIAAFVLRRRSAHVRYLLWLIVVVKCLVPPLHAVPLKVRPTTPFGSVISSLLSHVQRTSEPPAAVVPTLSGPSRPHPQESAQPSHHSEVREYRLSAYGCLGVLWSAGVAVYLAMNLLRTLRGHCWLRRMRRPLPQDIRAEAEDLLHSYGVRRLPRIWVLEGVGQPFVWGLLRGSIHVPPGFLTIDRPEHRRDILAHELSHVVRFDAAVNALQVIAQGLFWFHPLVWWVNGKIRQEREKCCDEMVIARLHTTPQDYGTAIVETLARARESDRSLPSLAVASPLRRIEERLTALLRPGRRFHKRPSPAGAALVILTTLVAVPTTVVLTAPPVYLVSGTIRVAPGESGLWDAEPKPFDRDAYAVFMRTQAALLSGDASLLSNVADDLEPRGLAFLSPVPGEHRDTAGILRRAIADGVIRIARVPDTELLEVTMVNEDREEAKAIVNSLLQSYVAQYGVTRTSLEAQSLMQLERQQAELRERIQRGRAQLRALMQRDGATDSARTPSASLEIQDRQSQIKLDEEFYERISRRLREVEMAQDRSPRVHLASPAEVRGVAGRRGR